MKHFVSGYRCLSCDSEYAWADLRYLCPRCDSNVEVVYDYHALKKKLKPVEWRTRAFNVTRYRELLPWETASECPLSVGGSPFFRSPALEKTLGHGAIYLKDDTRNPSASFKDRASWIVLHRAREEKAKVVAVASTGNAGASLSCLAAHLGQPVVIFVPRTAPKPKLAQLMVFGARVVAVNGNYDAAFDLCGEACEAFGWYNRSTGVNPLTREGKKTVSFEIFEQLGGCPDWVLVPTGDGNIFSGVWKGFKDLLELGWIKRLPRLVVVQSELSNAIAQSWRERRKDGKKSGSYAVEKVNATTRADSISVDFPRDALGALRGLEESRGLAVEVSDAAIFDSQRLLARTCGVFAEPSAAASVAGLRSMIRQGVMKHTDKVVCLVTGNGLKDVQAVLGSLGEPPVVEPNLDAVRKFLGREKK